jgi:S-(hydroxymethyl)glutathione dehydrogenase/alcohol dehydrogenase
VGLNIIQGARIARAGRVIALDTRPASLANAQRFGATDIIEVAPDDPDLQFAAQRVRELCGGRGSDFAFEATSVPRLAFSPLRLIRDGGMALQVSGINDPVTVEMPAFMWNKTYLTPLYGGCVPSRDFPRIFDHYLRRELLLDELVTRTYSLDELPLAIDDMMSGRNAKGVILLG